MISSLPPHTTFKREGKKSTRKAASSTGKLPSPSQKGKKPPEHSYDIYSSVLEERQRVRRVWKSNSQLPGSQLQFA